MNYAGEDDFDGTLTDAALQRYALLMLLEDREFLRSFVGVLKPEHFKGAELQWVVRFALDFYEKHKLAPTMESLRLEMDDPRKSWDVVGVNPELVDRLIEVVSEDTLPAGALAKHVHDRFEQWIQEREFEKAIRLASEHLDAGDPERAFEVVRESQRVRAKANAWLIIPDDLDRIFEYYSTANLDRVSMPIGIHKIDQAMEGGLRPGELGVIMAPLKRGKSMALVHIGAWALRNGFNVAHFSLENSDIETAGRYIANLGKNQARQFVLDHTVDEAKDMIRRRLALADSEAQVFIRWFPAKTSNADSLDAALADIESEHRIDLIIVDYGDLMRSRAKTERQYEEQSAVFAELRDLGMQRGIPIWTATQANRDALSDKGEVRINMIAESLGKAMKADFIIALSQSKEEVEMERPRMRMHIVAARRSTPGSVRATVEAKFEQAKFIEVVEDEVDEEEVEVFGAGADDIE